MFGFRTVHYFPDITEPQLNSNWTHRQIQNIITCPFSSGMGNPRTYTPLNHKTELDWIWQWLRELRIPTPAIYYSIFTPTMLSNTTELEGTTWQTGTINGLDFSHKEESPKVMRMLTWYNLWDFGCSLRGRNWKRWRRAGELCWIPFHLFLGWIGGFRKE